MINVLRGDLNYENKAVALLYSLCHFHFDMSESCSLRLTFHFFVLAWGILDDEGGKNRISNPFSASNSVFSTFAIEESKIKNIATPTIEGRLRGNGS